MRGAEKGDAVAALVKGLKEVTRATLAGDRETVVTVRCSAAAADASIK